MTMEERLRFEILIADLVENEGIKSANDLQNFSNDLHEYIENALIDYAYDNNFSEDYSPMY